MSYVEYKHITKTEKNQLFIWSEKSYTDRLRTLLDIPSPATNKSELFCLGLFFLRYYKLSEFGVFYIFKRNFFFAVLIVAG